MARLLNACARNAPELSAMICWMLLTCLASSVNCVPMPNSEICGGGDWRYFPLSGKCYSRLDVTYVTVNQTTASNRCSQNGGRLIHLLKQADSLDFFQYCIAVAATGSEIWTDAVYNGTNWLWNSSSQLVDSSLRDNDPAVQGNCTYFVMQVSATNALWKQNTLLRRADCASVRTVICEKPIDGCSLSAMPTRFNPSTMRLMNNTYGVDFYDTSNYGQLTNVQCRPGFYRNSDSVLVKVSYPATADGLLANQVYCHANATFSANVIEECYPIRCNATMLKSDMKIPHVKPYVSALVTEFYNYTNSFSVDCSRGYVSYLNRSSTRSDVVCGQNWLDKTQGEWQPPDLNTCTAVMCDDINNVLNPNSVSYKAYNREDSKEYGEFQLSSFPYYPNQVSIKCKQDGYFFEDRQFDKTIKCDLQNNSLIVGEWIGIYGTDLKTLKTISCKPVSCLSDTLVPRRSDVSALIKSLSFKTNVTVNFLGNGTKVVVDADAVNRPDEYPYASVIAFQCTDDAETGVGEPIAYCKSDGNWNISKLPSCIQRTANLELAGKKHYPPSQGGRERPEHRGRGDHNTGDVQRTGHSPGPVHSIARHKPTQDKRETPQGLEEDQVNASHLRLGFDQLARIRQQGLTLVAYLMNYIYLIRPAALEYLSYSNRVRLTHT